MADYGITPTGFVTKTQTELLAELQNALRSRLGATLPLSGETVLGQVVGILSERLALLWEALEAIYSSRDPDAAEGAALDAIAAITGTVRLEPTRSRVSLVAFGTTGTVLPAGRVVSVPNGGPRFTTTTEATMGVASSWVSSHVYSVGERATRGGNIYEVITAGTSASSGGPAGTGQDIADGTAHWKWLGAGTAFVEVPAEAQVVGPKEALSRTVTTIETPVAGWSSVMNPLDALRGRDLETDVQLRLRREADLRQSGNAALDALRSHILSVPGVTAATLFENPTGTTDADGMPPYSFEALVTGGDPTAIHQAIFDTKAAGIQAHGTLGGTVTDSSGLEHVVAFTIPTVVPIWVIVDVIADAAASPPEAELKAQVRQAIVDYGVRVLSGGRDVVASSIGAQAFHVDGVFDVPETLIGLTNPPTASTTLVVAPRGIAQLDSSRIVVNVTFGTL